MSINESSSRCGRKLQAAANGRTGNVRKMSVVESRVWPDWRFGELALGGAWRERSDIHVGINSSPCSGPLLYASPAYKHYFSAVSSSIMLSLFSRCA